MARRRLFGGELAFTAIGSDGFDLVWRAYPPGRVRVAPLVPWPWLDWIRVRGAGNTVSRIPSTPCFAEPKDAHAMRAKYDLEPRRTTILVSAGGFRRTPSRP
jgi:hypothetical protein